MIIHPIPPVFDADSEILILGSFPSVKSRESQFFYGHPQNRFWQIIAQLCHCKTPATVEDKKQMLLANHIAVWDVIQSCDITGSADASIRNVIPNDLSIILNNCAIRQIFCNGGTSHKLYKRFIEPVIQLTAIRLPSSSPANAACSLDRLIIEWSEKINTN